MVGMYEPYVDVCRLLDEMWPGEAETKSLLVNSGAEAVENAVKIARVATGRRAVIAFDHAFHGRTNLTMALTAKVVYKHGFGPLAPEVYRAPAPYPYRGVTTDDALAALSHLFKQDVEPGVGRLRRARAGAGRGRLRRDARRLPAAADGGVRASTGSCTSTTRSRPAVGRTGPVWAIEHYGVEPDLLVSGKSLGGGLPLAGVTGRADVMDAVPPGGLGGTFGGNPLACAAAIAVLDEVRSDAFRQRADEIGARLRAPPRRDRGSEPAGRRGTRPRADAGARARRADAGARGARHRGGARARASSCSRAGCTAT